MQKQPLILAAVLLGLGCSVCIAVFCGNTAPKPDIELLSADELRSLTDSKADMHRLMHHFSSLHCAPDGTGSLADLDGPARLVAATILYDELATHGLRPFPAKIPDNLSWQTAATAYEVMNCRPMSDLIRVVAIQGPEPLYVEKANRLLPQAHAARLHYIHGHAEELAR